MTPYSPGIHAGGSPMHVGDKSYGKKVLSSVFRNSCWLALGFGIMSAFYLTLRRSSDLRTVAWIPHPIALWADYHGRTRNLAAYAILALPVMALFRDRRTQLLWIASLGMLGTALEYGQLFIPTRWFEWQDIALSLVGLLTSWILVEGLILAKRRLRILAKDAGSH